jgi:uncharacterized membrane protein YdjX (TVP38/TMEM64 family)
VSRPSAHSVGHNPLWPTVLIAVAASLLVVAAIWFAWNRDVVLAWKEQASPFAFFTIMAFLPAVGAPLTPFYIVGGATFGLTIGLVGSAAALLVNFSLTYFVARHSSSEWLRRALQRVGYELPNFESDTSNPMRFTFVVKFTPGLPTFLKNYLLGISGVPFRTYLGVSMLVAGLYAVPLMALGDSLFKHDRARLWIFVLAGAAAFVWWWRRRKRSPDN